MKIGFTGTRQGMTPGQKAYLEERLQELQPAEFHHGDCLGADAEAADIAFSLGIEIICHPPLLDKHRAFAVANKWHEPLPYLKRNRAIVHATDMLLVAPKSNTEELRSGTWATWRYANSIGKLVEIIER